MELRDMRSLATLAECGSIQETALRCNLSPPAVHKHLKTIEDEFGVRVYTRGANKLEITDAGRLLLSFTREILRQHAAAAIALSEWKDGRRGVVRVGAGPSFSSYLLPPLVKRYRRRFPEIEVFVETATGDHLLERMNSGHLDLVFDLASQAEAEPGFDLLASWESPLGFICGRLEVPARCRLRELEKCPFILYQRGSRVESLVSTYFVRLGFRPRVVMRSDSAEAIKAMLRAGLGLSVLMLWNINPDLRSGALWVIRTDAPPLISQMALIKPKSTYATRAVQEFIALAKRMTWKNLHPAPVDPSSRIRTVDISSS